MHANTHTERERERYRTTGLLNAWIWLADKRSNVCNYFQGNAHRTWFQAGLDHITCPNHFAKWFELFQRSLQPKTAKEPNPTMTLAKQKPHSHCTLVLENCQKIAGVPSVWTQTRPGLIPGLIPGWDLVTLPDSVPERALCEQKPDQCRKGCIVVMMHFIVRQFYRVFWRQINVHTTKNV